MSTKDQKEQKEKEKESFGGPTPGGPPCPKNLFFIFLSIPLRGAETSPEVLRAHNQRTADLGTSTRLEVPDLVVGTLDSLMTISDELAKVDIFVEGVCKKVVQTLTELLEQAPQWAVNGLSPDAYVQSFAWDEKKYPWKAPLREIVARIQAQVQRLEQDLRAKAMSYSTLARAIAAESRKDAGTLMTRSLHDIVKPEDLVETEYLSTLLVVIPRHMYKEWAACYEKLTEFVLPRSSKLIKEDSEFGLYTVTLFKRVVEDYKNVAREKRFIVREFDRSSLTQQSREERERRLEDKNAQEVKLVRWCKINFGEVFSAWIHIKTVRTFVESVLRYGLPPKFVAPVLRPTKKDEKKVMTALSKLYAHLGANQEVMKQAATTEDEAPVPGGGIAQEKYYPFVYSIVDLDLVRLTF